MSSRWAKVHRCVLTLREGPSLAALPCPREKVDADVGTMAPTVTRVLQKNPRDDPWTWLNPVDTGRDG